MRLIKIYDLGKIEYLVNPEQISYIRVLPGLRGKKMYDIAFSDDVTIRTNYENRLEKFEVRAQRNGA